MGISAKGSNGSESTSKWEEIKDGPCTGQVDWKVSQNVGVSEGER